MSAAAIGTIQWVAAGSVWICSSVMHLMTIVQHIAAVKNRMFPRQLQDDELQMQATCGQWLQSRSLHLTLKAPMSHTDPSLGGCSVFKKSTSNTMNHSIESFHHELFLGGKKYFAYKNILQSTYKTTAVWFVLKFHVFKRSIHWAQRQQWHLVDQWNITFDLKNKKQKTPQSLFLIVV